MQNNWSAIAQQFHQVGLNLFFPIELSLLPLNLKNQILKNVTDPLQFKTLVLIGNGGKEFGFNFNYPLDPGLNPIDNFCLNFLDNLKIAGELELVYPSENHLPPLQSLGRLIGFAHASPMGIDVSLEYGPWFAYRLAFLTTDKITEKKFGGEAPSPCDECTSKECISVCPSKAVTARGLNVSACLDYLKMETHKCELGCVSRVSCPVKKEHQYSDEQLTYHMKNLKHLL